MQFIQCAPRRLVYIHYQLNWNGQNVLKSSYERKGQEYIIITNIYNSASVISNDEFCILITNWMETNEKSSN